MSRLNQIKETNLGFSTFLSLLPLALSAGIVRGYRISGHIESFLLSDLLIGFSSLVSGLIILKVSIELAERFDFVVNKDHPVFLMSSLVLILTLFLGELSLISKSLSKNALTIWFVTIIIELTLVKLLKDELFEWRFLAPTLLHFLDASTTVVALKSGAQELNILVNLSNQVLGVYSIFAVKTIFIVPITVYLIREETEYRDLALIVIALMGLAIGTSNLFAI